MDAKTHLTQQSGSEPGSYDLVIRVSKQILDPGENIQFGIYISGYGFIESACVIIYPSWSVFSYKNSHARIGDQDPIVFDRLASFVRLANTSFSETINDHQISTECNTPPPGSNAPISLDMIINHKVKPGVYSIYFMLKYYNGEVWYTKPSFVNFTVRNFYQRNETLVWILGGIAAFLTIISTSYPMLDKWLCKLIQLFHHYA